MEAPPVALSCVDLIGNTPLLECSRLCAMNGLPPTHRLLLKLEYFSPGASKKDRVAKQILADAIADGRLKPGQAVVEMTSGNTGTGLALACIAAGRKFIAVISQGNSPERSVMMRALGAEGTIARLCDGGVFSKAGCTVTVVVVPQAKGGIMGQVSGEDLQLVEDETQRIVKERNAWRSDQFNNQSNFRAHYNHTAPEIWKQSGGKLDAFVDFLGTGGTFGGCASYFKERSKHVQCYLVEPQGAALLAGQKVTRSSHPIQGGGYSMSHAQLPMIQKTGLVDGYMQVSGEVALSTARSLAQSEGVFAGYSTGANVAAALEVLIKNKHKPHMTVACVACDSGMKYLSTDLWPQSAPPKL